MSRHLIIGMGSIGKRHLRLLKESGEEVISFDKNFDNINPYQIGNIDMAWICTPTNTHLEILKKCLVFAPKIFIEKPIASILKDAEKIRKLMCQEPYKNIFIACNYRFHPAVIRLKENLHRVGKILYSKIHYSHYLPYQRENWQEYIKDTNIVLDAGIHFVDLALWLLGKMEFSEAYPRRLDCENKYHDFAEINIAHETCYSKIYIDYLRRDKSWGIEVIGTEGTLILQANKAWERILLILPDDTISVYLEPTVADIMYQNQLNYLLKENWQSNIDEHIEALKICV